MFADVFRLEAMELEKGIFLPCGNRNGDQPASVEVTGPRPQHTNLQDRPDKNFMRINCSKILLFFNSIVSILFFYLYAVFIFFAFVLYQIFKEIIFYSCTFVLFYSD